MYAESFPSKLKAGNPLNTYIPLDYVLLNLAFYRFLKFSISFSFFEILDRISERATSIFINLIANQRTATTRTQMNTRHVTKNSSIINTLSFSMYQILPHEDKKDNYPHNLQDKTADLILNRFLTLQS